MKDPTHSSLKYSLQFSEHFLIFTMVNTRTHLTGRRFSEASRRNIHHPPNFIRERRMVFYNHLPRHTVSANDEGTLADRIGWVIVHPNLYSHVEAQISHLPEVKDLIDI